MVSLSQTLLLLPHQQTRAPLGKTMTYFRLVNQTRFPNHKKTEIGVAKMFLFLSYIVHKVQTPSVHIVPPKIQYYPPFSQLPYPDHHLF